MSADASFEKGRLTVTHTYPVPRQAVFDAWIATSKVELWWGCGYATEVKSTIEPMLGGKYQHQMTLTNGHEYQHHGLITEYDPPAVLAYELVEPMSGTKMSVRVVFREQDGLTTVCLTQYPVPDAHHGYVMAGWSGAFEALAYLLETGGRPRERSTIIA